MLGVQILVQGWVNQGGLTRGDICFDSFKIIQLATNARTVIIYPFGAAPCRTGHSTSASACKSLSRFTRRYYPSANSVIYFSLTILWFRLRQTFRALMTLSYLVTHMTRHVLYFQHLHQTM